MTTHHRQFCLDARAAHPGVDREEEHILQCLAELVVDRGVYTSVIHLADLETAFKDIAHNKRKVLLKKVKTKEQD